MSLSRFLSMVGASSCEKRNLDDNARPGPRLIVDVYGSAQPSSRLLNSLQSSFVRLNRLSVKADAPILDLNRDSHFVLCNSHQHILALAVATGVEQQFPDDGKYDCLQLRREIVDRNVIIELDFRTTVRLAIRNQAVDGSRDIDRAGCGCEPSWLTNAMAVVSSPEVSPSVLPRLKSDPPLGLPSCPEDP